MGKRGKKGIKIEEIISLYNQGYSPVQIGEQLNCCTVNITRRIKKSGIDFKRDYTKVRRSRIGRHSLDIDFFKTIDNESKAYFLGLMYADGSVTENQCYIKLKDEDILQKFKEELKTSIPVKKIYYGGYEAYIIQISSKDFCNNLISQGCMPNKTRILQLPTLEDSLYRHFIRGFFDGDGCLQLQDKKYHCRFDLTSSSKEFLEQLRPIITSHAKTNGYLGKETKYEVWHLNYSGHQVQQILDWLYENSNFYLKRKYVKYQILSSL